MSHSHHGHNHGHHHDHQGKNIGIAIALNLGFAVMEFFGGLWTGSLAIMADSLHDLGDALALGLSYVLERKSAQKSDQHYSYGYRRFSLLGALINAVILLSGSVWVIQAALQRLQEPTTPYAPGMVGLAVLGILVNGAGFFKLKNTDSLNQRMVSLHLLEDLFGWVVVLVASVAMWLWGLPYLDPLCSIFFSLMVAFQVYKALRETLKIMLMSTPADLDGVQLQTEICDLPCVTAVHDFHLWTLDGNYHVLTCHLVIQDNVTTGEREELKKQAKAKATAFGVNHTTLELEGLGEECEQTNCIALEPSKSL